MKQLILLLIFSSTFNTNATTTSTLVYNHSHLDFAVEYNDRNHFNSASLNWKYLGLSTQLNEYIQQLVKNNILENKKINISYWLFPTAINDDCWIQQSQNNNGYYIQINENPPSHKQLIQLINYFGSSEWESFICSTKNIDQQIANTILFERINKMLPVLNFDEITNQETVVFEQNNLVVSYKNDCLQLTINQQKIAIDMNNCNYILPQLIGQNYIIVTNSFIYIYSDTKRINAYKRSENYGLHSAIRVHKKWFNFYENGDCVLSYSLEKNKFYKVSPSDSSTI